MNTMKLHLILFMNLAAVASLGSSSPVSILDKLSKVLPKCNSLVDRVKKFQNCSIPNTYDEKYLENVLPYMCFLSVNLVVDLCTQNATNLWEGFKTYYDRRINKTICPFLFSKKGGNISADVMRVARYFENTANCERVCNFNKKTEDDCIVMASLNDLTLAHEKKVSEGENIAPLAREKISIQNNSRLSLTDVSTKTETGIGDSVNTNGESKYPETPIKTRNNVTMKSEISSKFEIKKNTEKFNSRFDRKNKVNDSKPVNRIYLNNHTNDFVKTPEIEIPNEVYASGDKNFKNNNSYSSNNNNNINNNNNNISNINNNVHNNRVVNNFKKEETKEKVGPYVEVSEAELPLSKNNDDSSPYGPQSKNDYTYVPANKVSSDEDGDDDNNEGNPENVQLQDALPDREYDTGRVSNQKELYNADGLFQAEDSHFSGYFLMIVSIIIIGYIIYHNKNKIVAYALEGRRGRNGRRRPTSASYRKLDCNLEEAITSNPSLASATNVVY